MVDNSTNLHFEMKRITQMTPTKHITNVGIEKTICEITYRCEKACTSKDGHSGTIVKASPSVFSVLQLVIINAQAATKIEIIDLIQQCSFHS